MKTSPEAIRCVNGCGNLTNDMHDDLASTVIPRLIGLMFIIVPVIFIGLVIEYDYIHFDDNNAIDIFNLPLEILLAIVCGGPFMGLLLILSPAPRNNIVYFCCEKCGGKLLDSKTLRTKLGWNTEKALIIENLLEDCNYGVRECPTCEAKMKVLDLGYKKDIDTHPLLPTMTGKRNIELDGCIECSHIWFDKSEFSKILGEAKTKSLKLNLKQSENTQNKNLEEVYRKIR